MEFLYKPGPDDKLFYINFIRNKIMSLNKPNTKTLFLHLCVCINEHNEHFHNYNSNECCAYLSYLARDITFAKLKTSFNPKKMQHYMVIHYCNKFIDNLNIGKIIKSKNIISLLPDIIDINMKFPSISYSYSPTIRGKITNYKQVISEGITPTECGCETFNVHFKDTNSDHIFTGNLDIIQNTELRKLMKKGLNYREIPPANKNTVYKSIAEGIDSYISKISEQSKVPIIQFKPWKMEILKTVQQ